MIEGSIKEPKAAYDLKTGSASLSKPRIRQLEKHLPESIGGNIKEIKP